MYSDAAVDEVDRVIRSGAVFDYTGAGPVAGLEETLRSRYALPHALTLNSGTSAIFVGLAALGIGPGDEVVVAGWTFLSAVTPLLWLGATPVLADVAESQPVADAASIGAALTPRTRAVIVTHLFGEPVDTVGIQAVLAPLGIALMEDCSHAHATDVCGEPPGARADVAVFSLGARKIVSGGHGGALMTRHADVFESALMIGHNKPRTRNWFAGRVEGAFAELALGGNLRMSPLSAVLAADHLARLDELSAARLENVAVLEEALRPIGSLLRSSAAGENRTYFDLVWDIGACPEGVGLDRLLTELDLEGVPARRSPTRPLSRTIRALPRTAAHHGGRFWGPLAAWGPDVAHLQHAEALHDRSISLPSELLWEAGAPFATLLAARITRVVERMAGL